MKTNKHLTLLFIQKKVSVRNKDIVYKFDYTPGTARSYLSRLSRQGLLVRTGMGYIVSAKGQNRLNYFEASGCGNFDCPNCQTKTPGYITCPKCKYQLSLKEAKIRPKEDFLSFTIADAGVYCHECDELVLTESKAISMGIPREDQG